MAHKIRLGGNIGAHPPKDPNDTSKIVMSPQYSDAIIEFTKDYLHHVYVTPARLAKLKF
jgi:hypothetical protein